MKGYLDWGGGDLRRLCHIRNSRAGAAGGREGLKRQEGGGGQFNL